MVKKDYDIKTTLDNISKLNDTLQLSFEEGKYNTYLSSFDKLKSAVNELAVCNLIANKEGLFNLESEIVGVKITKTKFLKRNLYWLFFNEFAENDFILMYYKDNPVTSIFKTKSKRILKQKMEGITVINDFDLIEKYGMGR